MSLAAAAVSTPLSAFIGAAIPATIAAAVAIYVSVVGRKREDQQRRRDVYSEAYRLALDWCEAIYRVRRRAPDGSEDRDLVEHFHQMQERIAYYQGWLVIENVQLGEAYQELLNKVLRECKPLIQAAWREPGRDPTHPPPEDDVHPDLAAAKQAYLARVRWHLASRWTRLTDEERTI